MDKDKTNKGRVIIVNKIIRKNDNFPVEVKCKCGRTLLILTSVLGCINQEQKCQRCKNIISINIVNKHAS